MAFNCQKIRVQREWREGNELVIVGFFLTSSREPRLTARQVTLTWRLNDEASRSLARSIDSIDIQNNGTELTFIHTGRVHVTRCYWHILGASRDCLASLGCVKFFTFAESSGKYYSRKKTRPSLMVARLLAYMFVENEILHIYTHSDGGECLNERGKSINERGKGRLATGGFWIWSSLSCNDCPRPG